MERPQSGREIREAVPGLRGTARRSIRATGASASSSEIGWSDMLGSAIWLQDKEPGHELPNYRLAGRALRPFVCTVRCGARRAARRAPASRWAQPGYPCRVSLTDSRPGDELMLVNYEHHPVASPYRMRFAIYVRKGEETYDRVGEVPEQLRIRTLAVRAFDADAMMVGWELVDGRDLEAAIERRLADARAAYLHVHFAAAGCYAAKVERA